MELIFATNDFKIDGMPYEGFPLLFRDDMNLFYEGVEFLIYHCLKRGSVASKGTWDTYGRDLYDFFSFIEANGLDWRDVQSRMDSTILAVYRDASMDNFNLSASTVNRRLRLLVKFYQYAVRRNWVNTLPYEMEEVMVRKPKGFLAHTDTSGGVKSRPDVMMKTSRTQLKVLNAEQVKQLLYVIDNKTLKLMVRLGLLTGLRKEEILSFPLKYIVNPLTTTARSHIAVKLSPQDMETKGSIERTIMIPVSLMADLWDYTIHERNHLLSDKEAPTGCLFVTQEDNAWSLTSKAFNNLLNRLDLPFKVYPHLLRHTYATFTLRDLEARRVKGEKVSFNPLLYVRDRLGHVSITTTEKYLHFIHEIECDLRTAYELEIEQMCMEAAA